MNLVKYAGPSTAQIVDDLSGNLALLSDAQELAGHIRLTSHKVEVLAWVTYGKGNRVISDEPQPQPAHGEQASGAGLREAR